VGGAVRGDGTGSAVHRAHVLVMELTVPLHSRAIVTIVAAA
jgi:hypothetical protein